MSDDTNTNLVPVNLDQLPSTQIGSDDQFADLAKSADFVGRLQLFTKGKAINLANWSAPATTASPSPTRK